MNQELFDFSTMASFLIATDHSGGDSSMILFDAENASILVSTGDGEISVFPLISEDGEPLSLGLRTAMTEEGWVLEIGQATFLRSPLIVQYIPINESEFHSVLKSTPDGGHIGIIDIRDLRVGSGIKYYLERLPISLSLAGNSLVVSTVFRLDSDVGPEWYETFYLTRP
jgi:hypothetical protein